MSHIDLHQKQFSQREAQQRIVAQRIIEIQRQITNATRTIQDMRRKLEVLEKSKRDLVRSLQKGYDQIDEVIINED